jgi:transcriptional regulator GlxA family with amidase domain
MARTAADLGVNGKVHFKVPELAPSAVSDTFDELCAALDRGEDAAVAEAHHARFLSELLYAVGEGAPARRPRGRYHPGVRRAVKYLATHLREAVSLNDLAATARMSKYHLVRVFREAEGFAPHQYLTLLRIREARRLVESGLSVVDAAGQAGFVDASHLSRTFRGWLGIAPGAWGRAFRASEPPYRHIPLTLPPPPEEELDLVSGGP